MYGYEITIKNNGEQRKTSSDIGLFLDISDAKGVCVELKKQDNGSTTYNVYSRLNPDVFIKNLKRVLQDKVYSVNMIGLNNLLQK